MRHHQQPRAACRQILFEPLGHIGVEVVGRLVEDQQVRLAYQHVGQRHALELSARKGPDPLSEVADLQPRQNPLGPLFVIPRFERVHAGHRLLQSFARRLFDRPFVFGDGLQRRILREEAGFQHGHLRWIDRTLFEVGDPQIAAGYDAAAVVILTPRYDVQERGFSGAVLGDEGHAPPVLDRKRYIFEEYQIAERFGQVLHLKTTSHNAFFCVCKATQKYRTDNRRPETGSPAAGFPEYGNVLFRYVPAAAVAYLFFFCIFAKII